MTGIRVVATSEVGQSVVKRIVGLDHGRTDWRPFFRERVECDDPYRILIEHKNRIARSAVSSVALGEIVRRQLEGLGAVFGVDFEVNVV